MFTRCSNCKAIFEVSQQQLAVREGLVRCGVCKHVFNAKWFLLDREPEGDPREEPELSLLREDPGESNQPNLDPETQEESIESEGHQMEEELEVPPVPDALLEEIESRLEPSLGELQESPIDEEWGLAGASSYDTAGMETELEEKQAAEPDQEMIGGNDSFLDDDLDAVPVEELDDGLDEESDEELEQAPAGEPDRDVDNEPGYASGEKPGDLLGRERMADLDVTHELEGPSLDVGEDLEVDRDASYSSSGGGLPPEENAPISLTSVDTYLKERSSPLATLLWTVAALIFLFALVLQVRTFHIETLAANKALRPYIAGFCRIAACELPPRRDSTLFSVTHTRIAWHPEEPGAMRIGVNLINEAEFDQLYPDLQLTLTDRVGRIVGRRSFKPTEYLGTDVENLLAPKTLGEVQIDLAHPHEQAVGFEIVVVDSG